jgi:hypothetical protein
MSIRDEVNRCVAAGTLISLRPALPAAPVNRTVVVSVGLYAQLFGPWELPNAEIRWNRARADLDWFIEGRLLLVTEDGHMKPLVPESDGVWEIACRNPKPSIRILGGFTETDVFAALTWRYRQLLGPKGSQEWAVAIRECKAEWKRHFLVYAPHVGGSINDYISENAVRI